jgi:hypothetical protein
VRILLLSQEDCVFCDAAEQMLERLSNEFPLLVSKLSLDSFRGQELARENGILFAPGLFIDDEAFSYGRPSERRLRRAIEQRLSERQP